MPRSETATHVLVWLALSGLLAVTVASAYVDLGVGNVIANVSIAALKAALVGGWFMHLRRSGTAVRFTIVVAVVWLAILLTLTLADHLSR